MKKTHRLYGPTRRSVVIESGNYFTNKDKELKDTNAPVVKWENDDINEMGLQWMV